MTTSLAYLRELDLIAQRRAETVDDPPAAPKAAAGEGGGWSKKKAKAKGKWTKRGQAETPGA